MSSACTTIWGSLEADAWSRDFKYPEYVEYLKQVRPDIVALSETSYTELRKILDIEMSNNMTEEQR